MPSERWQSPDDVRRRSVGPVRARIGSSALRIRFFSRARFLGPAFGPVLFQLPPRWPVNVERFQAFLRALPRRHRYAVEFRDPTWYTDAVFALLQRHRVALCVHDMAGSASGRLVTAPFVYVRFHGSHGLRKYSGTYSDQVLDGWAEWLSRQLDRGLPAYACFNNDLGGHAPRDAVRLRQRLPKRHVFAA